MTHIENAKRLRPVLAQAVQSLNGTDALTAKSFYPSFDDVIGQTVKIGFKFTYGNKLFKTIQPEMTIQAYYPPSVNTASLYTEICETHDGSKYDPIPYDGNMVLENGKYYVQNGITYLCIRDSGTAVYHALADLVGLYVELA